MTDYLIVHHNTLFWIIICIYHGEQLDLSLASHIQPGLMHLFMHMPALAGSEAALISQTWM